MKKRFLVLFLMIIIISGCANKKTLKNVNTLMAKTTEFEYGDVIKVDELFENDYSFNDILLDTSFLGTQTKTLAYEKDGIKYEEDFTYTINDTTSPLLWVSSSYTYTVGDDVNLLEKIICADNYDKKPNCYIKGNYDLNKVGTYHLTFVGEDSHNNKDEVNFTLYVKEKSSSPSNPQKKSNISIEDVIKEFKTTDNMIGIDVSKWQGSIDFKKVKNAGIEFVMIRMGVQKGFDAEIEFDPYFKQNIESALENGLKVGLYFYSYATTKEQAISQAKWVIENISEYKIEMPIAFDWENFSYWNLLGISLFDLRSVSYAFQDTIKEAGYTPVQYGSKSYLNSFWFDSKYDTWLAHYLSLGYTSDYQKKYIMWQMCNNGSVPGINGNVDIDIYYPY